MEFYYDREKKCGGCSKPFLFYAAEQKFWWEVLGIPIEISAVRCCACRSRERKSTAWLREYNKLRRETPVSRVPSICQRTAALMLILRDAGKLDLKSLAPVRTILNRVPVEERGPDWTELMALARADQQSKSKAGPQA